MKQFFKIASIALIASVMAFCGNKETSVVNVDLSNRSGGRTLELNELMSEIRVVRLETSKESILGSYYLSFIGEKYIIILTDKSIHQFDHNGNFIRILGKQGKGPGEFTGVNQFAVDISESKLYIHHYGKRDQLLGFDLSTGKVLPSIILPYSDFDEFVFTEDHILFIGDRNSPREIFTCSFEGGLLDTLSNIYQKSTGSYSGRGTYLKKVNNRLYYLGYETDSLYILDGARKSAVYFFNIDNRYNFYHTHSGNLFSFSSQTETQSLLDLTDLHIEKIEGGSYSEVLGNQVFLLDNKSNNVDYISKFYHNFFDMEVEEFSFANRGNVAYMKYSALDFKELISKSLNNKKLDPDKAEELTTLDNSISLDDNPIYLIGKAI